MPHSAARTSTADVEQVQFQGDFPEYMNSSFNGVLLLNVTPGSLDPRDPKPLGQCAPFPPISSQPRPYPRPPRRKGLPSFPRRRRPVLLPHLQQRLDEVCHGRVAPAPAAPDSRGGTLLPPQVTAAPRLDDDDVRALEAPVEVPRELAEDDEVVPGGDLEERNGHGRDVPVARRVAPVVLPVLVPDRLSIRGEVVVPDEVRRGRVVEPTDGRGQERPRHGPPVARVVVPGERREVLEDRPLDAGAQDDVPGKTDGAGVYAEGIAQRAPPGDVRGQRPVQSLLAQVLGDDVGPERVAHEEDRPALVDVRSVPGGTRFPPEAVADPLHDPPEVPREARVVPPGRRVPDPPEPVLPPHVHAGRDPAPVGGRAHHGADVPEGGVVVHAVDDEHHRPVDAAGLGHVNLFLPSRRRLRGHLPVHHDERPVGGHPHDLPRLPRPPRALPPLSRPARGPPGRTPRRSTRCPSCPRRGSA
ncbi:hypothetical protein THAOC_09136 [Thalassiosira oceanica]|uniref:Uncharacterized protein n=1 Tax=Thalassiosira oceanica TaxID=159749 RepID=K0SXB6_THAOC|nr:hypothetical protein THAOC_09136 [Thalassiosira oceanica]|eukprot:EJK69589.1 hypothetical protein THAOC_09136 [Thalassiosira oceanica]